MMNNFEGLAGYIDEIYANKKLLKESSAQNAIESVLELLDAGRIKVSQKIDGKWHTHQWIKKAILLSFSAKENKTLSDGVHQYYDKIPIKGLHTSATEFKAHNTRFVPGSVVRHGSYVGPNGILMPSFINIGAHVGQGTMIDTWSTVGSCAQIGENCHISGGVGIGGVLEPLQANPVIIEDNCFIGARSEIAEGVLVEEGAVISMGVFIGASSQIIDRETGKVYKGRVPAYSVVVPGSRPSKNGLHLNCAVIVKRVNEKTREKTAVNDILREAVNLDG